ncbi:MAG: 4Fe-4S binding protein [Deltaproteobacteria bacterium]
MKVCEKSIEKENVLAAATHASHGYPDADGVIRKVERFFVENRKNLFYVHIAMILVFLVLIAVPAFLPAPSESDGLSSNFVLFSKFMVWGLWFPLVFISVIFLGRFWCGTLCPQGALTEYANKKTLNKPVPRLLTYGWVPVSSFIIITIAGQVVGVRDYPLAALELFGVTTLAAVLTGFLFARERRVWCRYLCPVGPLLGVFSRLGAISFENKVTPRPTPLGVGAPKGGLGGIKNAKAKAYLCPTFINTQTKTASSNCIECFKCVELNNPASLHLSVRRPGREVEEIRTRDANPWEVIFIFAATGLSLGAFYWQSSQVFVEYKQSLGGLLMDMGLTNVIGWSGPWWLMVNYPQAGDVFNLLDAVSIITFMLGMTVFVGGVLFLVTALSSLCLKRDDLILSEVFALGYAYAPVALVSLVAGLGGMLFDGMAESGIASAFIKQSLFIAGIIWSAHISFKLANRRVLPAVILSAGVIFIAFLWKGALF